VGLETEFRRNIREPLRLQYSIHIEEDMGKSQSKSVDSVDGKVGRKDKKHLPRKEIQEEVFVQKIAYKCGVSKDQLEAKKETYIKHAETNPSLGYEEFKALYRDLSVEEDKSFMAEYVDAIFRAFDANKDSVLTFKEWQVGFYLLLLFPKNESAGIGKEDANLALEIIYRLYDQDGDNKITQEEIGSLSRLLRDPVVGKKLSPLVHSINQKVAETQVERFKDGLSQEEFVKHFSSVIQSGQ